MRTTTAFFLILLRLAIGGHFLIEGLQKAHSIWLGPTTTNRPFDSAAFFREAPGPAGPVFRNLVGDPDEEALARLTPLPDEGQKAYERLPPALAEEWDAYLERFKRHYDLDEHQAELAAAKLQQAREQVVLWLEGKGKPGEPTEVKKTFPSGVVEVKQTVPQRVADYRARLEQIRQDRERNWEMQRNVEKARLTKDKADAALLRASLLADLDSRTADMKKSLADVLTDDQRQLGPVPEPSPAGVLAGKLPDKVEPLAPPLGAAAGKRFLAWINWLTMLGLTVMGACLLLGLFTRINCVLAASFLLLTFLLYPPLPWLPLPPNSEGNYLFVNKNLVELLALLALATTASGRWFGLDGILYYLKARRRQRRALRAGSRPLHPEL